MDYNKAALEMHETHKGKVGIVSKVENSILFKKVFVGKNCVIKNSIILNDVYIGDNTHIENCIVESRDTLKANTYYCGDNGIKIVSENNERYVL